MDHLLVLKEKNRQDKVEHGHEQFTISLTGVKEQVTVARAEQQLQIQGQLHLLNRDINRASRLGKAKVDALSDLERRILVMRHQLKEYAPITVEENISETLRQSNNTIVEHEFTKCSRCQRKILVRLFHAHEKACLKRNPNDTAHVSKCVTLLTQPVKTPLEAAVMEHATFIPQPPRNFRVKDVGATYITWEWDPPVSDGGLPVLEYEMAYTFQYTIRDETTNKLQKVTEQVPSLMLTRWCRVTPIPHNGVDLVWLRSDAEYSDFQIRCLNNRGWSEWAEMNGLEKIHTLPAETPSKPQFFECVKITSSCVHLKWDPPFFTGGQAIIDYIIYYTTVEREISAVSRGIFIERERKLNVGNGTTHFAVLRNIKPETKVVRICIKSVNKAGLESDLIYFKGEEVVTKNCSRYMQLLGQLKLVEDTELDYIDTDFFTVGQLLLDCSWCYCSWSCYCRCWFAITAVTYYHSCCL